MSQSPAEAVGDSSSSQRIVILIISKVVLFGLLGLILLLTRKNKTELHSNEWIAFSAVFAATLLSGICIYKIELGIKLGSANKILFFHTDSGGTYYNKHNIILYAGKNFSRA